MIIIATRSYPYDIEEEEKKDYGTGHNDPDEGSRTEYDDPDESYGTGEDPEGDLGQKWLEEMEGRGTREPQEKAKPKDTDEDYPHARVPSRTSLHDLVLEFKKIPKSEWGGEYAKEMLGEIMMSPISPRSSLTLDGFTRKSFEDRRLEEQSVADILLDDNMKIIDDWRGEVNFGTYYKKMLGFKLDSEAHRAAAIASGAGTDERTWTKEWHQTKSFVPYIKAVDNQDLEMIPEHILDFNDILRNGEIPEGWSPSDWSRYVRNLQMRRGKLKSYDADAVLDDFESSGKIQHPGWYDKPEEWHEYLKDMVSQKKRVEIPRLNFDKNEQVFEAYSWDNFDYGIPNRVDDAVRYWNSLIEKLPSVLGRHKDLIPLIEKSSGLPYDDIGAKNSIVEIDNIPTRIQSPGSYGGSNNLTSAKKVFTAISDLANEDERFQALSREIGLDPQAILVRPDRRKIKEEDAPGRHYLTYRMLSPGLKSFTPFILDVHRDMQKKKPKDVGMFDKEGRPIAREDPGTQKTELEKIVSTEEKQEEERWLPKLEPEPEAEKLPIDLPKIPVKIHTAPNLMFNEGNISDFMMSRIQEEAAKEASSEIEPTSPDFEANYKEKLQNKTEELGKNLNLVSSDNPNRNKTLSTLYQLGEWEVSPKDARFLDDRQKGLVSEFKKELASGLSQKPNSTKYKRMRENSSAFLSMMEDKTIQSVMSEKGSKDPKGIQAMLLWEVLAEMTLLLSRPGISEKMQPKAESINVAFRRLERMTILNEKIRRMIA